MVEENKKWWYVVDTHAGHGDRIKENLSCRMESVGLQDYSFHVIAAEKKKIEYKNGKKIKKTTNLFSSYLLVETIMTDEIRCIVRNASGVTKFIGSSGGGAKSSPVAEEEMESILHRLGMSECKVQINSVAGDRVRILGGALANVEGTAEELHEDSQTAAVLVILFGCETPTEIGYGELEKVEL